MSQKNRKEFNQDFDIDFYNKENSANNDSEKKEFQDFSLAKMKQSDLEKSKPVELDDISFASSEVKPSVRTHDDQNTEQEEHAYDSAADNIDNIDSKKEITPEDKNTQYTSDVQDIRDFQSSKEDLEISENLAENMYDTDTDSDNNDDAIQVYSSDNNAETDVSAEKKRNEEDNDDTEIIISPGFKKHETALKQRNQIYSSARQSNPGTVLPRRTEKQRIDMGDVEVNVVSWTSRNSNLNAVAASVPADRRHVYGSGSRVQEPEEPNKTNSHQNSNVYQRPARNNTLKKTHSEHPTHSSSAEDVEIKFYSFRSDRQPSGNQKQASSHSNVNQKKN